jgi:SAM-dependent methyltransferase
MTGMKRAQWFYAASERWHDWKFGIRTGGLIPVPAALNAPGRVEYSPIAYRHLLPILARLPAGEEDVFLDYGCGLGRVLVAAARRNYRSVIGVELVPEFADAARENVRRARGLQCRDVRVIEADATTFALPDCVTVLHFYNPFRGPVLDAVLRKVRESLDRSPRVIHTLYFNRDDFHRAAAGCPWIEVLDETRLSNPVVGCGLYNLRG